MSKHHESQILNYLDDLNKSTVVNMLDYTPELSQKFGLNEDEAKACILLWLKTFSQRFLEKRSVA